MSFIGFLIFVAIAGSGFWLLLFLLGILPYWIGGNLREAFKEKFTKK